MDGTKRENRRQHKHNHRSEEITDYRGIFSGYTALLQSGRRASFDDMAAQGSSWKSANREWLSRGEGHDAEIEGRSEQGTGEKRRQARSRRRNQGQRKLLEEDIELEGRRDGEESGDLGSMNLRDSGEGMVFGDDGEVGYGAVDDYARAHSQTGGGGKDDALGEGYLDDDMDLIARGPHSPGGGEAGALGGANESEYVLVDAHVLTTPTVADINNDGHVEILLSVSYFFDRTKYGDGKPPPAPGVDPSKYVAGGVVCYDLQSQEWAWSVHLDLTTDEQHWRAYIFGVRTGAKEQN